VPTAPGEMLRDADPVHAGRVMRTLMQTIKLDITALKTANDGGTVGECEMTCACEGKIRAPVLVTSQARLAAAIDANREHGSFARRVLACVHEHSI
jgi:hypothetical protein